MAPPGRPADLLDYLLPRWDESCGKSIPELIMKEIYLKEKLAENPVELRVSQGQLACMGY